jgi:hypothetical protein
MLPNDRTALIYAQMRAMILADGRPLCWLSVEYCRLTHWRHVRKG